MRGAAARRTAPHSAAQRPGGTEVVRLRNSLFAHCSNGQLRPNPSQTYAVCMRVQKNNDARYDSRNERAFGPATSRILKSRKNGFAAVGRHSFTASTRWRAYCADVWDALKNLFGAGKARQLARVYPR